MGPYQAARTDLYNCLDFIGIGDNDHADREALTEAIEALIRAIIAENQESDNAE